MPYATKMNFRLFVSDHDVVHVVQLSNSFVSCVSCRIHACFAHKVARFASRRPSRPSTSLLALASTPPAQFALLPQWHTHNPFLSRKRSKSPSSRLSALTSLCDLSAPTAATRAPILLKSSAAGTSFVVHADWCWVTGSLTRGANGV